MLNEKIVAYPLIAHDAENAIVKVGASVLFLKNIDAVAAEKASFKAIIRLIAVDMLSFGKRSVRKFNGLNK